MKEALDNIKKNAWVWLCLLVIGFGLGKLYTYDAIALDCKILGTFRYANIAFHCKTVAP